MRMHSVKTRLGKDMTVLRDTGCTGAVVKRRLVEEDQLPNSKCSYISIDRTMKPVQVARVYIVSTIYTGYFEALCVEDPLSDVVIGNLPKLSNRSMTFFMIPRMASGLAQMMVWGPMSHIMVDV